MSRTCSFVVAVAAVFVSACSSTPAVAPPRPLERAQAVPVRDLASRHGLRESYEAPLNRLLLSGEGHRVLLFPGTTVAVVNGQRIATLGKIEGGEGRWTISAQDAERIETALHNRAISVPASHETASEAGPHPVLEKVNPPVTASGEEPGWRVPLKRSWRYIIIHHSGTTSGNAALFHRVHKQENGWDGLGYDFVIGNGHGSPDGRVEIGYRWTQQRTGAHAGRAPDGTNLMNESGVGICLVGNFDGSGPTAAQRESLARLIGFLRGYCGIPAENVLLHKDVRDTVCPGRHFPAGEYVVPGRRGKLPANLR